MMPAFLHSWMALSHLGKSIAVNDDDTTGASNWAAPSMDQHFTLMDSEENCAYIPYISVVTRNGASGGIRFEIPRKLKHIFDVPWLPDKSYLNSFGIDKEVTAKLTEWDNQILEEVEKKDYFFVDD